MKKNGNVAAVVRQLAEPLAERLGYDLWDVEFVKEGADYCLRITIDSPQGITIDDCERMHLAIDPVLDEADPIEGSYRLEVSSPGVERGLKTPRHMAACEGWTVEVRLYAPADGSKCHIGERSASVCRTTGSAASRAGRWRLCAHTMILTTDAAAPEEPTGRYIRKDKQNERRIFYRP